MYIETSADCDSKRSWLTATLRIRSKSKAHEGFSLGSGMIPQGGSTIAEAEYSLWAQCSLCDDVVLPPSVWPGLDIPGGTPGAPVGPITPGPAEPETPDGDGSGGGDAGTGEGPRAAVSGRRPEEVPFRFPGAGS